MSPHDAVAAGIDGASTLLDRVDTERVVELATDLAATDVTAAVASTAGAVTEQVASALRRDQRTGRATRVAVGVGVALLLFGGVIWYRKRRQQDAEPQSGSGVGPA